MTAAPDDPAADAASAAAPGDGDAGPGLFGVLPEADKAAGAAYRVLARKYRPQTFAELVGQEAMVRTLTNAFASGRIAHAFVLTGVRGVGKTTTARILAKCLNAEGGPNIAPDPADPQAVAIAEDRHPDVMEMDAASRTGVDDIREIIEGVRYRPVMGRYKVYIIDEVHMLSRNAFNALLKTLEEPPPHVKFVFATTEIRKVPVTVLSRCQRFDLRRVDAAPLVEHLGRICAAEGIAIEDEALRLVARAADGSVRDGLSLLDQAIATWPDGISAEAVRGMLGLADRTAVFDLFEATLGGDAARALGALRALWDVGADPAVVLRDMMELAHWLTRVKLVPATADDPLAGELERTRGKAMAEKLSVAVLGRTWQMLLKGVAEVDAAPAALPAAEMVLVRLAYAADLPPPADLVRRLTQGGSGGAASPATAPRAAPAPAPSAIADPQGRALRAAMPDGVPAALAVPAAAPAPSTEPDPADFRALVGLFSRHREVALANHLRHNVHLVAYEPGRLEIHPSETAPRDLSGQVLAFLRQRCGAHWQVVVSPEAGGATLAEQDNADDAARRTAAARHPVVRAVLDTFPGARIERVTPLATAAAPAGAAVITEVPGGRPPVPADEIAHDELPPDGADEDEDDDA